MAAGLGAARAQGGASQPLWEVGAVAVGVSQQAYPGAGQTVERGLALPYFIYRGRVLRADGSAIPGLYAAGACSSTLAQDGKGYSSGTQLGSGSFFGRRAGAHAAARAT